MKWETQLILAIGFKSIYYRGVIKCSKEVDVSRVIYRIVAIAVLCIAVVACYELDHSSIEQDRSGAETDRNGFQREAIWKSTSTKIEIDRGNGFTSVPPDSTKIVLTREELLREDIEKLQKIASTQDNLECWEDGIVYKIKVFDEDGTYQKYISNSIACPNLPNGRLEVLFIDDDDFSEFLSKAKSFCDKNRTFWKHGDTFKDEDGCNTCSCGPSGSVTCSEKHCSCTEEGFARLEYINALNCCDGLFEAANYKIEDGCDDYFPLYRLCIACGNGTCDQEENDCNCPHDCGEDT